MSIDSSLAAVQEGPGIVFQFDAARSRRKLSLMYRATSLIPYIIVSFVWLAIAFVASVVAWFTILFTGRYPSPLFDINASAWRFLVRVNSYSALLVDARPPFSGRRDPQYPLYVDVAPLPEYNRLLTAFRLPLLIPLAIVTMLALLGAYVAFIPSLATIALFRRQPKPLQSIIALAMRLDAKFISSSFLLTEILWVNG